MRVGAGEQFVVSGLIPGTLYSFAIRAIDDWVSAASVNNNVSVTTLASDAIPPARVVDLSTP